MERTEQELVRIEKLEKILNNYLKELKNII